MERDLAAGVARASLAAAGAATRVEDPTRLEEEALARDLVALLTGFRAADLPVVGDFLVEVLATRTPDSFPSDPPGHAEQASAGRLCRTRSD